MAKRLAQRTARRKREHLVDQDEKIIPINHETDKSSHSKSSCFENTLAVNRGRKIHCFSTQASPFPIFSAMSPLMKYGRAYCRLQAILE